MSRWGQCLDFHSVHEAGCLPAWGREVDSGVQQQAVQAVQAAPARPVSPDQDLQALAVLDPAVLARVPSGQVGQNLPHLIRPRV